MFFLVPIYVFILCLHKLLKEQGFVETSVKVNYHLVENDTFLEALIDESAAELRVKKHCKPMK